MFLFNIKVFDFQTNNLQKKNWSKGGLQQNGFFYQPVFWKMSKVIVFFAIFWQFLVDVQKHYKNR